MAAKRLVMCTSSGCLQYGPDRYKNLGIDIIPIHLFFRNKEYLEGTEDCIDPQQLYNEMKTTKDFKNDLPHTAMPTFEEISAHFDKAIADGYDEVICICISSGLGGTWNFISLVANNYRDKLKIHVIDSKIVAFNEGYLAVLAQKMINEGKSTEEILDEIEWTKSKQRFIGYTPKLDYLIFNGRLKGAKAFMGKLIKVCPILMFNKDGELVPLVNKVGPKAAAEGACQELIKIINGRDSKDYILLRSFSGSGSSDKLIEAEKKYPIKTNHEDMIFDPVSGVHCGPWIAGYNYIPLRRDDER